MPYLFTGVATEGLPAAKKRHGGSQLEQGHCNLENMKPMTTKIKMIAA